MTYCDLLFLLVFLPATILGYNIFPQKHRGKILLVASYAFFVIISGKLIAYLLATTLLIYASGLLLRHLKSRMKDATKDVDKEKKKILTNKSVKKQKAVLILTILALLGSIVIIKYSGFIETNLNNLFNSFNLQFSVALHKFTIPIGISFYTLQAISYIMDVYRGKIEADKNLGRLALFISFFPQIMEGPICRYSDTAQKLWEGERTNYKGLTFGTQRIMFGLMKKIVIADRLNPLIEDIFNGYTNQNGAIIAAGMVLYTLQLYMDFSGVMDVVIGVAEIFNVKMPENFRQPFFSKSISEFWTRWHITLGTWFKDYVYFPISMSKLSKKKTSDLRKRIGKYYGPLITSSVALAAVWFCNGVWHGSAWSFIFFGLYHFVLIMIGRIITPLSKKITNKLGIKENNFLFRLMQIIRTTIFVFFGELFFRANGLLAGFDMFKRIFTDFNINKLFDGALLEFQLDVKDYIIIAIVTVIVLVTSILKEKGINIRESIAKKNIVVRWGIYLSLFFIVVIFGAYGIGYIPVAPMYAQF